MSLRSGESTPRQGGIDRRHSFTTPSNKNGPKQSPRRKSWSPGEPLSLTPISPLRKPIIGGVSLKDGRRRSGSEESSYSNSDEDLGSIAYSPRLHSARDLGSGEHKLVIPEIVSGIIQAVFPVDGHSTPTRFEDALKDADIYEVSHDTRGAIIDQLVVEVMKRHDGSDKVIELASACVVLSLLSLALHCLLKKHEALLGSDEAGRDLTPFHEDCQTLKLHFERADRVVDWKDAIRTMSSLFTTELEQGFGLVKSEPELGLPPKGKSSKATLMPLDSSGFSRVTKGSIPSGELEVHVLALRGILLAASESAMKPGFAARTKAQALEAYINKKGLQKSRGALFEAIKIACLDDGDRASAIDCVLLKYGLTDGLSRFSDPGNCEARIMQATDEIGGIIGQVPHAERRLGMRSQLHVSSIDVSMHASDFVSPHKFSMSRVRDITPLTMKSRKTLDSSPGFDDTRDSISGGLTNLDHSVFLQAQPLFCAEIKSRFSYRSQHRASEIAAKRDLDWKTIERNGAEASDRAEFFKGLAIELVEKGQFELALECIVRGKFRLDKKDSFNAVFNEYKDDVLRSIVRDVQDIFSTVLIEPLPGIADAKEDVDTPPSSGRDLLSTAIGNCSGWLPLQLQHVLRCKVLGEEVPVGKAFSLEEAAATAVSRIQFFDNYAREHLNNAKSVIDAMVTCHRVGAADGEFYFEANMIQARRGCLDQLRDLYNRSTKKEEWGPALDDLVTDKKLSVEFRAAIKKMLGIVPTKTADQPPPPKVLSVESSPKQTTGKWSLPFGKKKIVPDTESKLSGVVDSKLDKEPSVASEESIDAHILHASLEAEYKRNPAIFATRFANADITAETVHETIIALQVLHLHRTYHHNPKGELEFHPQLAYDELEVAQKVGDFLQSNPTIKLSAGAMRILKASQEWLQWFGHQEMEPAFGFKDPGRALTTKEQDILTKQRDMLLEKAEFWPDFLKTKIEEGLKSRREARTLTLDEKKARLRTVLQSTDKDNRKRILGVSEDPNTIPKLFGEKNLETRWNTAMRSLNHSQLDFALTEALRTTSMTDEALDLAMADNMTRSCVVSDKSAFARLYPGSLLVQVSDLSKNILKRNYTQVRFFILGQNELTHLQRQWLFYQAEPTKRSATATSTMLETYLKSVEPKKVDSEGSITSSATTSHAASVEHKNPLEETHGQIQTLKKAKVQERFLRQLARAKKHHIEGILEIATNVKHCCKILGITDADDEVIKDLAAVEEAEATYKAALKQNVSDIATLRVHLEQLGTVLTALKEKAVALKVHLEKLEATAYAKGQKLCEDALGPGSHLNTLTHELHGCVIGSVDSKTEGNLWAAFDAIAESKQRAALGQAEKKGTVLKAACLDVVNMLSRTLENAGYAATASGKEYRLDADLADVLQPLLDQRLVVEVIGRDVRNLSYEIYESKGPDSPLPLPVKFPLNMPQNARAILQQLREQINRGFIPNQLWDDGLRENLRTQLSAFVRPADSATSVEAYKTKHATTYNRLKDIYREAKRVQRMVIEPTHDQKHILETAAALLDVTQENEQMTKDITLLTGIRKYAQDYYNEQKRQRVDISVRVAEINRNTQYAGNTNVTPRLAALLAADITDPKEARLLLEAIVKEAQSASLDSDYAFFLMHKTLLLAEQFGQTSLLITQTRLNISDTSEATAGQIVCCEGLTAEKVQEMLTMAYSRLIQNLMGTETNLMKAALAPGSIQKSISDDIQECMLRWNVTMRGLGQKKVLEEKEKEVSEFEGLCHRYEAEIAAGEAVDTAYIQGNRDHYYKLRQIVNVEVGILDTRQKAMDAIKTQQLTELTTKKRKKVTDYKAFFGQAERRGYGAGSGTTESSFASLTALQKAKPYTIKIVKPDHDNDSKLDETDDSASDASFITGTPVNVTAPVATCKTLLRDTMPGILHLAATEKSRSGKLYTTWADIGVTQHLVYSITEHFAIQIDKAMAAVDDVKMAESKLTHVEFPVLPAWAFSGSGDDKTWDLGFQEIGPLLEGFYKKAFGAMYNDGVVTVPMGKRSQDVYFAFRNTQQDKANSLFEDIPLPESVSRQIVSGTKTDMAVVAWGEVVSGRTVVPYVVKSRLVDKALELVTNKRLVEGDPNWELRISEFEAQLSEHDIKSFRAIESDSSQWDTKDYYLVAKFQAFMNYHKAKQIPELPPELPGLEWLNPIHLSSELFHGYIQHLAVEHAWKLYNEKDRLFKKIASYKESKDKIEVRLLEIKGEMLDGAADLVNLEREQHKLEQEFQRLDKNIRVVSEKLQRLEAIPMPDNHLVMVDPSVDPSAAEKAQAFQQHTIWEDPEFKEYFNSLTPDDQMAVAAMLFSGTVSPNEVTLFFKESGFTDGWTECPVGVMTHLKYTKPQQTPTMVDPFADALRNPWREPEQVSAVTGAIGKKWLGLARRKVKASTAATQIQRWWRKHRVLGAEKTDKTQEDLADEHFAKTTLRKALRAWVQGKRVESFEKKKRLLTLKDHFDALREAALINRADGKFLKKHIKAWKIAHRYRRLKLQIHSDIIRNQDATLIQSAMRMKLAKMRFAKMKTSAVKIQTWYRSKEAIKKWPNRKLMLKADKESKVVNDLREILDGVVRQVLEQVADTKADYIDGDPLHDSRPTGPVEAEHRGGGGVETNNRDFTLQAVKLQSRWRGYKGRQRVNAMRRKLATEAANKLASERREMQMQDADSRAFEIVLRKHLRKHFSAWRDVTKQEKKVAIDIQRMWQGYKALKAVKAMRRENTNKQASIKARSHDAARVIQRTLKLKVLLNRLSPIFPPTSADIPVFRQALGDVLSKEANKDVVLSDGLATLQPMARALAKQKVAVSTSSKLNVCIQLLRNNFSTLAPVYRRKLTEALGVGLSDIHTKLCFLDETDNDALFGKIQNIARLFKFNTKYNLTDQQLLALKPDGISGNDLVLMGNPFLSHNTAIHGDWYSPSGSKDQDRLNKWYQFIQLRPVLAMILAVHQDGSLDPTDVSSMQVTLNTVWAGEGQEPQTHTLLEWLKHLAEPVGPARGTG